MISNKNNHNFINIFPRYIQDEFLFSIDNYKLFLERLSINPLLFYDSETDLSSINRNNSTIEEYFIKDVTDSNTVEFVGLLKGDVDGSWSSELENNFENSSELTPIDEFGLI